MRKIVLVLVCAFFSLHGFSQKKSTYFDNKATWFTKEITDYITNLSLEQTQQIWEINKRVSIQFDSLKRLKLEKNEYSPAARTIFVERDEAFKKIMNDNQFDMFLMQQAEKREESWKRKQEHLKLDSIKNNPKS